MVTDIDDIDDHDRQMALEGFANEILALEDSSDCGHTPHLLAYDNPSQDHFMPYPGGYLRVIIMSKLPGQNVREVLLDLSEQERSIIRDQLTSVLEYVELRITAIQKVAKRLPLGTCVRKAGSTWTQSLEICFGTRLPDKCTTSLDLPNMQIANLLR
jgi:hypothetical protein